MPGFLSLFDATEKIDVTPPGADGSYWVEIKHYLTSEEDEVCTEALLGPQGMEMASIQAAGSAAERRARREEMQTAIKARMDQAAHTQALIAFSIVGWNLTDREGAPLPLTPGQDLPPRQLLAWRRPTLRLLPDFVRDRIAERLMAIREERKKTAEERATFRGEAARGDHDGDWGAAGTGGVPGGGGLLAAPRLAEG